MELLIIIIGSGLAVPLVVFSGEPVRIIVGLLFVLVLPGYTLLAVIYPRKTNLDGITRLALSLGMSLSLVILILLILNYTPWGYQLYPILISLILFTDIMAVVAWFRRKKFVPEERYSPFTSFRMSSFFPAWTKNGYLDRTITVILVAAVIGVIGTLGFVTAKPTANEYFTEFYLLDAEDVIEYYPADFTVGEAINVTVGIVNRESDTNMYNIEILIDGESIDVIGPIDLDQGEKWEKPVTFTLTKAGSNQKVEFLLYGEQQQPIRTLYLWINVRGEVA